MSKQLANAIIKEVMYLLQETEGSHSIKKLLMEHEDIHHMHYYGLER